MIRNPLPTCLGMRGEFAMRRLAAAHAVAFALVGLALATVPGGASARKDARPDVRAAGPCQHADTPVTRASVHAMRAAVLCLVNKQRAAHGLPGLHASQLLNRSAQGWTNAMIRGDFFSHGSNFAARISAVGFLWSSAGENIATGFSTPRRVVIAWMHSTGHCQNILNPTFRDVGTGVSASAVRGYASGAGTWTQDFALPRGQRSLSGNWGAANHCPY
jgi:uncharacterized protein YkwD